MMLKGITQTGRHTLVSGGHASMPYINNYSGQAMVGQLRLNPSSQSIEVYDGNTWLTISATYASVGLTPQADDAIDWAIRKRAEEQQLATLMEKHPGLKEAYERLEIMKALCLEEEKEKHD